MLRDRLNVLFNSYDPNIRQIIAEVGDLEQRHISMERPRIKEQIDEIITRIARQELKQSDPDTLQE